MSENGTCFVIRIKRGINETGRRTARPGAVLLQRRRIAVRLLAQGVPVRKIADQLGMSTTRVHACQVDRDHSAPEPARAAQHCLTPSKVVAKWRKISQTSMKLWCSDASFAHETPG